jgi:hypothetical protein
LFFFEIIWEASLFRRVFLWWTAFDRDVLQASLTNIEGFGPDEPVCFHVFQGVRCPTGYSAHCKNRCEQVGWNSQGVKDHS